MHSLMSEWEERLQRQQQSKAQAQTPVNVADESVVDDLTLSFIESMEEIREEINTIKDSNGTLFTALQNMLNEVILKNTEALVNANNQFMHLIMRKLDELEERITSDEPAFTNVLYSDPELFNEISARGEAQVAAQEILEDELSMEEEFAAKNKIAEMVEQEHPGLLEDEEEIPQAIVEGFTQFKAKEIKWSQFVKIAGGIQKAGHYKRLLSSSS